MLMWWSRTARLVALATAMHRAPRAAFTMSRQAITLFF